MTFEWNDELVDKLAAMVLGGRHSFSEIGAELGCGKNGAIGKWHRIRDKRGLASLVPVKPRPPRVASTAANRAKHWSEAEIATLREMYLAGAIFTDIAAKLGRSAAACHGRAVLMGLPSRGNNNFRLSTKGKKRASMGFKPRLVVGMEPPSTDRAASILDVTGCRWAITPHDADKGSHMFCNHPTEANEITGHPRPYCPYHSEMSRQRPVPKAAVKRFIIPTALLRVVA